MRRCIGLDVHREFAEVAVWEDGVVRAAGQIKTTPEALRLFAASLCEYDEVALEATCNTHAIARLLERHVGRVLSPAMSWRFTAGATASAKSTGKGSPPWRVSDFLCVRAVGLRSGFWMRAVLSSSGRSVSSSFWR